MEAAWNACTEDPGTVKWVILGSDPPPPATSIPKPWSLLSATADWVASSSDNSEAPPPASIQIWEHPKGHWSIRSDKPQYLPGGWLRQINEAVRVGCDNLADVFVLVKKSLIGAHTQPIGSDVLCIKMDIVECGHLVETEAKMLSGGKFRKRLVPVHGYAVHHPSRGIVLIDSGFPECTTLGDTGRYPGAPLSWFLNMSGVRKGDTAKEKMMDENVKVQLFTHLHHDHCGGAYDFPGAKVVVHGVELDEAQRNGWRKGYVRGWLDKLGDSDRLERFELNKTPTPGCERAAKWFPLTYDVFGDGSIIACGTRGHTLGHLSYLIHTKCGEILLAGDAAWLGENVWTEGRGKPWLVHSLLEADGSEQRKVQRTLSLIWNEHPQILVLAAHDYAEDCAMGVAYNEDPSLPSRQVRELLSVDR